VGRVHVGRVTGNTVWSHMTSDAPQLLDVLITVQDSSIV